MAGKYLWMAGVLLIGAVCGEEDNVDVLQVEMSSPPADEFQKIVDDFAGITSSEDEEATGALIVKRKTEHGAEEEGEIQDPDGAYCTGAWAGCTAGEGKCVEFCRWCYGPNVYARSMKMKSQKEYADELSAQGRAVPYGQGTGKGKGKHVKFRGDKMTADEKTVCADGPKGYEEQRAKELLATQARASTALREATSIETYEKSESAKATARLAHEKRTNQQLKKEVEDWDAWSEKAARARNARAGQAEKAAMSVAIAAGTQQHSRALKAAGAQEAAQMATATIFKAVAGQQKREQAREARKARGLPFRDRKGRKRDALGKLIK